MDAGSGIAVLFESRDHMEDHGLIRVERWPEGIVLWVGGQIRWKSWGTIADTIVLKVDASGLMALIDDKLRSIRQQGGNLSP